MVSSRDSERAPDSRDSSAPSLPFDLVRARELVQILARTAKATRIYARNNEVYLRFWRDLQQRMQDYLERFPVLSLQVGVRALSVQGEVVFEPREADDSFAFRLYKDGLRQIDFHRGLPPDELQSFLDIITADFERGALQDRDVVSLLWECEFKHILTLSVDSFVQEAQLGDDDEAQPPPVDPATLSMEELEADQLVALLQQSAEINVLKLDREERKEYDHVRGGLNSFTERHLQHRGRIFEIDAEQLQQLSAEVEHAGLEETPMDAVGEVLFELFRQELPEEYPELIRHTLAVIDGLLIEGDLEGVIALLFPLRSLSMPEFSRAFLHHELVEQLFLQLGTPEHLEPLILSMNENRVRGGVAAVFGYFSVQLPESVPALLIGLERVSDDSLRRAAVDALMTVLGEALEPVRATLRSPNAALVADMLRALGRLGNPQSLELILSAATHPDARVREESLIALRQQQSPRAREVMLHALEDSVEAVRMVALRTLTVNRDRQAARMVTEFLEDRHFKERSFTEMRAMCMALAYLQGQEALSCLDPLLKQRRNLPLLRAAAHGVSAVGGVEARRILERTARDVEPAVAFECQELLARMK